MLTLPKLDFSNFKGDLFGGLTAGIVALPLALAFGEQTEMGAIAGLYGAIAVGMIAALFGGTPTQVSGPTAPMTVVSAVVIADAIDYTGSLSAALPIILSTFCVAGILQILLGAMKIGKYVRYIPYSVVSGFMSGIGVIIIVTQLFPFIGVNAPNGGPLGTLQALDQIPENLNYWSIGVATLTILIIYGFPKITKVVPSTLIALLALTVAVVFWIPADTVLQLNSEGPIPSGIPAFHFQFFSAFSDLKNFEMVLQYAVTLAFLGAIDSLLTAVVADNITKTKHDSDQELVGQGLGNIAASIIGGLPGAGATMRTVINIRSGGKTNLSAIFAGVFLLIVLLGAGPIVGYVPNAVLAGILITVGIGIIDYRGFRDLTKVPKSDAIVMVVVLLLTVFVDLLVAVAVGMVIATVLFMKKTADLAEERSFASLPAEIKQETTWDDEAPLIDLHGDHVFIKHLDGPLFFGFASAFQRMMNHLPTVRVVIIRMDRVPYIDQTGLYALEDAVQALRLRKIAVIFVGLQSQPLHMLEGINFVPGLVRKNHLFPTVRDATPWVESYLDGTLEEPEAPKSGDHIREV